MKTILVPTDFSACADNAAHYAIQLARVLRADVKLCNAIQVTTDGFSIDNVIWPLLDYNTLKRRVNANLKAVCNKLRQEKHNTAAHHLFPEISFTSQVGDVTEVVKDIVDMGTIPLVVMGMSGAGGLSRLLLGSNSSDMIDNAHFPLILVPADTPYKPIKKITCATDFNQHDLTVVYSLVSFARNFNAEILIANIGNEKHDNAEHHKSAENFLSDITCKANYDKIYYRYVKSIDVAHGLNWLYQHSFSDLIVMSHGKHNIIDTFFGGSNTKKLARHVNIPLMVYPKEVRSSSLIVF